MFVQKGESADTPHGMTPTEKFYFRSVTETEPVINIPDFAIFISYPFIRLYDILMTAFHHERPGEYEVGHLGIAERAAHIEIGHFPFHGSS